jgi:hypothetical protein
MTVNQAESLFLTNENKFSQIDLQKHLFKTFQMLLQLESTIATLQAKCNLHFVYFQQKNDLLSILYYCLY